MTPLQAAVLLVNEAHKRLAHAERCLFAALEARERGHVGRRMAECGTPAGYRRHWLADEDSCAACRAAHRRYEARRKAFHKLSTRYVDPRAHGDSHIGAPNRHADEAGDRPYRQAVPATRSPVTITPTEPT